MKLTRKRAQELAKVMRAFASKHLADGLETWKGEDDMISMVRGDARDFREIAKLLCAGKIQDALDAARIMDTLPRDRIPDDVWDAMVEHCNHDEIKTPFKFKGDDEYRSSLKSVKDAIEREGFEYTFICYSYFDEVQDEKFHELRKKFLEAHNNLAKYLGEEYD